MILHFKNGALLRYESSKGGLFSYSRRGFRRHCLMFGKSGICMSPAAAAAECNDQQSRVDLRLAHVRAEQPKKLLLGKASSMSIIEMCDYFTEFIKSMLVAWYIEYLCSTFEK